MSKRSIEIAIFESRLQLDPPNLISLFIWRTVGVTIPESLREFLNCYSFKKDILPFYDPLILAAPI